MAHKPGVSATPAIHHYTTLPPAAPYSPVSCPSHLTRAPCPSDNGRFNAFAHRAQKALRDLKSHISSQSKKNFVLEKDVRYLDSRIALLVQNRMALEEQNEVASHLDDSGDLSEGSFPNDEKTQKYGNLLFLLQTEPRHIAHLCRLVTMAEIDALLQTVMFTLYGNQYESREEHLLLTMFQVSLPERIVNDLH